MKFFTVLRPLIATLLLTSLLSCGEDSFDKTISFEVSTGPFVMRIPIEGELEASVATSISMPGSIFEPQVIAWLAEENTLVKKGDVIARFDTTKYIYDSKQVQLKMQQVDISYDTKASVLTNEKGEIVTDANLIAEELVLADRFALEDLNVFSKNEIIDSMKNKKYLEARQNHTEWRGDVHQQKSSTELDLLDLERQKHESKLTQYSDAMDQMAIKAPHDGLFVLEKTRRGDKPRVGDITWPGRKIGSLPDMNKLQAKVDILESEAAGLDIGLRVEFTLDAYPDEIIQGKVVQIDAIAKAIERESPVKYFGATIEISSNYLDYWRPGVQLRGRIYVIEKQNVLSIPSQAIFREQSNSFVYINDDGEWDRQEVVIGSRSLSRTEIKSGIEDGDIIALYEPRDEEGS